MFRKLKKHLPQFFSVLTIRQRRLVLPLILSLFFGSILEIAGVGLVLPIITLILEPSLLQKYIENYSFLANLEFLQKEKYSAIVALLLMLFIYLVKGLYLYLMAGFQTFFAFDCQSTISNKIFTHYVKEEVLSADRMNSSVKIRNIIGEVSTLTSNFILPLLTFISEIFVLIGIAILIMYVAPISGLFAVGFLFLSGILFNYFTKRKLAFWGKNLQLSERNRVKCVQEALESLKDIKLRSCEEYFIKRYQVDNSLAANYLQKNTWLQAAPRILIEILAIFAIMIIALGLLIKGSENLVPVLGLFASAAFRIMPSYTRLITSLQYMQNSFVVFENIVALSQLKGEDRGHSQLSNTNWIGDITLNNINFSHDGIHTPLFSDLNFKIVAGTSVGLVGESGSGKSTLINLILGLLRSKAGEVCVDGVNIFGNIAAWRSALGYVPQNIYLLDDTIRNNVAFGVEANIINESQVIRAIERAGLADYLIGQDQGLDTIVGERGSKLSGGQRQRLGIARALYNDPQVLILDEATSALDAKTEKKVMQTIETKLTGITKIMISHRVRALDSCDVVYELKCGKITTV